MAGELQFRDAKVLSMNYEAQMLGEIFQYAMIKRITISGYMDSSERASWGNINSDNAGIKENWQKLTSMSDESREGFWAQNCYINGFYFGKGRVLSIDFGTRPNMVRLGEYVAEIEIYEQSGSQSSPAGLQGPDLSNMKDRQAWKTWRGNVPQAEIKIYKSISDMLSWYGPLLEDISEDFSFDHGSDGNFSYNQNVTVKFRKEYRDTEGDFSRTTGVDVEIPGSHTAFNNKKTNEDFARIASQIASNLFYNNDPVEFLIGNIGGDGTDDQYGAEGEAETSLSSETGQTPMVASDNKIHKFIRSGKKDFIDEDYDFMNCSFSFSRRYNSNYGKKTSSGVYYGLHATRSLSRGEDGSTEVTENGEITVTNKGGFSTWEAAAREAALFERDSTVVQVPGIKDDNTNDYISFSFWRCSELYASCALGLSDDLNPDGGAGAPLSAGRSYWQNGYPLAENSTNIASDGSISVFVGNSNFNQSPLLSGLATNRGMSLSKSGISATYSVTYSTNKNNSNRVFAYTGEMFTAPYIHEYSITTAKDLSGTTTTASISGTLTPTWPGGGGFDISGTSGWFAWNLMDGRRRLNVTELQNRHKDCSIVAVWAQAEAERHLFRTEDLDFGRLINGTKIGTAVGLNGPAIEPMTIGAKYFTTKRNWEFSPYGGPINYSYELVNDQTTRFKITSNAAPGVNDPFSIGFDPYNPDTGLLSYLTKVEATSSDTVPVGIKTSYTIPWHGEIPQIGFQTEIGARSVSVTGQLTKQHFLTTSAINNLMIVGSPTLSAFWEMYNLARREVLRIPWYYSRNVAIRDIWYNSLTFSITNKGELNLNLEASFTGERANAATLPS